MAAVAAQVGLPRSTAHRLVQALRAERFLRDSEDGLVLGAALIELGMRSLAENPLAVVARPILRSLSEEVGDTVHLAVHDAGSVLYLAKFSGSRGAEMRSRVGYRMPLTRTGVGKALLLDDEPRWAQLWDSEKPTSDVPMAGDADEFVRTMSRYRALGYAFDLEENEPGIRCVAAPIRDADGAITGAISVSATIPYIGRRRLTQLAPRVMAAAMDISQELGYRVWV